MALKIAKDAGLTDIVSDANPITTEHPIAGSAVEVQAWLYNDDNTKYYTGVSIDPTDIVGTDESAWIQLAPDNAGAAGAYGAGSAALAMADIGASGAADTTGKPFWIRVTTPAVADSQNKSDIKLTVAGKEYAV